MAENKKSVMKWLLTAIEKDNIAVDLEDDVLNRIGGEVTKHYELDFNSRTDWQKKTDNAMKLAQQVQEEKDWPWEGASNIKYPLLTEAAIQFASRALPELIKGTDIVKCEVTGDDPDGSKDARAKNISMHMSWQLDKQMPEWVPDVDRALHTHPIVGGFVKKSYFDPSIKRNVSELINLEDYVVNNKANRNRLRRESHRYWYYQNDILEKMRSGVWLEQELGEGSNPDDAGDDDQGHEIIEQHCFKDLDGDGYKEPYIITVHRLTSKVLRIVARFEEKGIKVNDKKEVIKIVPVDYFTMYIFLPDPAGGFYPMGFGQLLEPLNESINTLLNQLVDAGTMSNRAGGFFARGVRFRGTKQEFNPFEWKPVDVSGDDIRKAMFPLPVREPSAVLFQLLGLLIQAAKDTANIKDVLTGETKSLGANASPTTVMSLIEQGMKVFSGIYKRFYRSLTEELRKLYRLNAIYLEKEESFRVAGKPYKVGQADYQVDDLEVLPIADPNMASDMQRRLQAESLLKLSGRPGLDEKEITRRCVRALRVGEEDKLIPPDEKLPQQQPDPKMLEIKLKEAELQLKKMDSQAKVHEAGMRFRLDATKHQLELEELKAKIGKLEADTMLAMARTDDLGRSDAVELYKHKMDQLAAEVQMKANIAKEMVNRSQGGQQMGAPGQPEPGGAPPGTEAGQEQPPGGQMPPGGVPEGMPVQ